MSQHPSRSNDGERLAEALSRMPRAVRIAFLLHARRGLSFERIAARLHVSRRRVRRYFIVAIRHIDQVWREP
jgi:DNA-directed RNA polymerase specialized sigma24 family protein